MLVHQPWKCQMENLDSLYRTKQHQEETCPTMMRHVFSLINSHMCWLVVWNMFYFSIYWEFHHPIWLIFFRGVGIPPTRCQLKSPWETEWKNSFDPNFDGPGAFIQFHPMDADIPNFNGRLGYPLVNIQKTMENHHILWVNQLFRLGHWINSYVQWPEGTPISDTWFFFGCVVGFVGGIHGPQWCATFRGHFFDPRFFWNVHPNPMVEKTLFQTKKLSWGIPGIPRFWINPYAIGSTTPILSYHIPIVSAVDCRFKQKTLWLMVI